MPLPPSLTKMTFTATSGNVTHGTQEIDIQQGVKLGANSILITHPGIKSALSSGSTINHSLQLEYGGGLSVVKFDGTPYVPPPPIMLDTNGVTLKYTSSSIPSGQSNPYIVQVSGTYYAVMSSNNDDSKSKITAYAANFSQPITNPYVSPFVANGTKIPFNRIVTTLMTDMSNMFYNAAYFNQNLSTWDTSNVTNMTSMFYSAHAFNNGDNIPISGNTNSGIGYWNTSKVTNMTEVFYNALNFNRDIGSWDVSSVNNMDRMFGFAYNFNNGNNIPSIGSWQTLNVQSMKATFYSARSFNRNISGWTVSGLLQNPMPYFSDRSGLTSNTIPKF